MTDILWTDDFTTDHFHDGRYRAMLGTDPGPDNNPADGSWYVGGDGLHADYLLWDDETNAIGDAVAAFVEIHLTSIPFGRIGFTPPDTIPYGGDGHGLYLQFVNGAFAVYSGPTLLGTGGGHTAFFDDALTELPADAPVIARLTVDAWGFASWGIEVVDGWFPVGGSAQVIGGYGRLPFPLAALAEYVPFVYLAGSVLATEWSYGMLGRTQGVPSDIQAQSQAGGVVRTGPAAGGNSPSGVGIS